MIVENVYSIISDENIQKNLINSPIWKNCYKEDEIFPELLATSDDWYKYTIKFDGLIPTQVTNIAKL